MSIVYSFLQVVEWLGWLGSQGGPESGSTVVGLVLLLTPSLFLAPTFLALMVSVQDLASRETRVWARLALAFATIYATLVGLVYYVQLTFVAPRMSSGRLEGVDPFLFVPFDSFLYSVDLLGYTFMSLSTLFVARVFRGDGKARLARLFLTANGMLIPFLALQIYYQPLIWGGALWALTFPGSMWILALYFRDARPERSLPPDNGRVESSRLRPLPIRMAGPGRGCS